MAYEVILETGEEVAARIELNLSKKAQPFHFAVSNRAVYIPRVKLIAKTDPYYFQRIPLNHPLLAAAVIGGGVGNTLRASRFSWSLRSWSRCHRMTWSRFSPSF